MATQDSVFDSGEWIVHASYGVGQVRGKEKKVFEGQNHSYIRVRTYNGVYWLPVEQTEVDYIRPLASKYQIRRALTMIRRAPKILSKDYKKRSKQITAVMKDVSLYAKARMIRDLYYHKRLKKLNYSENEALEKLIKRFLDEWSLVTKKEREALETKLMESLRTSTEKVGT